MPPALQAHDDARTLVAFLREHVGHVEVDEVGPWIGQAALIEERGELPSDDGDEVQRVLNAALAH